MAIRQPILSVLGHVDHGKTTLLDRIRGTSVTKREFGRITQHIGATEVPTDTIKKIAGPEMIPRTIIPGLLFIDTPGHHSFTTLRSRGGALADMAVLIVDILEGLMPQSIESLRILREHKTPFVVALNKVDRINGWVKGKGLSFREMIDAQEEHVLERFDQLTYKLIGQLFDEGFNTERFDRIKDFRRTVAIIPICAEAGDGLPDLLAMLVGLAQKFLHDDLDTPIVSGPGEGTVLEVKEKKGLGTTLDTIIYSGRISYDDTIVVGGKNAPIVTRVKALLKPKPLDEIRDPREKFDQVRSVSAAIGVKIVAPGLEDVVSGSPLRVANENLEEIIEEVRCETEINICLEEQGIIVKADAIGSLEAISNELLKEEVPINRAEVGDISRRDVVDASTMCGEYNQMILGFNVKVLPDAQELINENDVEILMDNVLYKLLEDFAKWRSDKRLCLDKEARGCIVHPGKFEILPDCIFRVSKPAVVGIRVLCGRVRKGQRILRSDGRVVGLIQSLQLDRKSVIEAKAGDEVAISVEKVTVGRQIDEGDVLYVDIPEEDSKKLRSIPLNVDEEDILETVRTIKRKESKFWGM